MVYLKVALVDSFSFNQLAVWQVRRCEVSSRLYSFTCYTVTDFRRVMFSRISDRLITFGWNRQWEKVFIAMLSWSIRLIFIWKWWFRGLGGLWFHISSRLWCMFFLDVFDDFIAEVCLLPLFSFLSNFAFVWWCFSDYCFLGWSPYLTVLWLVFSNIWRSSFTGVSILPGVSRSGIEGRSDVTSELLVF